ncbi:MAG: hypothetical protein AABX79_02860 [Nanoarchaeota archaeon]
MGRGIGIVLLIIGVGLTYAGLKGLEPFDDIAFTALGILFTVLGLGYTIFSRPKYPPRY